VVYWDASVVLSALFKDGHSDDAMKWTRGEGVHLLTSLGYAESCAVIARLQRERILADALVEAAHEALADGPWRRLNALPDWSAIVGALEKVAAARSRSVAFGNGKDSKDGTSGADPFDIRSSPAQSRPGRGPFPIGFTSHHMLDTHPCHRCDAGRLAHRDGLVLAWSDSTNLVIDDQK
jgi:predicted nucleic acid-binding protein